MRHCPLLHLLSCLVFTLALTWFVLQEEAPEEEAELDDETWAKNVTAGQAVWLDKLICRGIIIRVKPMSWNHYQCFHYAIALLSVLSLCHVIIIERVITMPCNHCFFIVPFQDAQASFFAYGCQQPIGFRSDEARVGQQAASRLHSRDALVVISTCFAPHLR